MINSRDIGLLRDDVGRNVRTFLRICEEHGLRVCVTQTVRDDAYQEKLYAQGRTVPGKIVTNSRRTTYHGAGLAFDICQNIRGQEYSDADFFRNCAIIAKHMGFTWGGDWKNFPDAPHFQWDEQGRYQFSRSKGPAEMPIYEEDEMITEKSIAQMSDGAVMALVNRMQNVLGEQEQTGSLAGELEQAIEMGITYGEDPKAFCTRAQAAVMNKRLYEKVKEEMKNGV